jgi:hypothetical protein
VGEMALADYRHVYRADFAPVFKDVKVGEDGDHQFYFIMQAKKPSRISI